MWQTLMIQRKMLAVPLILMLHYARNGAMTRALKEINKLAAVKANSVMIRVENFE